IVMDVVLPTLDGYEVTKAIRAKEGKGHVPILLLAAGKEVEHKVRGLRAGADDYLNRPFDPAELLARVRSILVRFAPADARGTGTAMGRIFAFYGAKGGAGTTT